MQKKVLVEEGCLSSNYLHVMHRGKVAPACSNNEFDHDVAGGLIDPDRLLLLVSTVIRDFARFTNRFEAITVRGLAALDLDLLDTSAHEAHLVHDLRALELKGQLLGEHSSRQPERVVVSIDSVIVDEHDMIFDTHFI